ncbi:MAG: hypothetical protein KBT12_01585 [Bacteroidales bacterium]|nr:hypothetical protein [Candidatus Physcousia equi]
MLQVANPIYDIVFKYLMEDERVAKTILSALLQKEVVEVEQRRNEYANSNRDGLSIFRIDFGAKVRDEDGSLKLILIELQKTWLETETLRFRQYLATHYANAENIYKNDRHGYAIPMVTVYLLGHKVGQIEEPILYVKRKSYDYEGREVTKGIPDPFVDSLTHDSIIVQIPRLHGQVNNRLEEVLNVFDQERRDVNHQTLTIDETLYAEDSDVMYILRRLKEAASDSKLRHDMNVEDEYFSAIEHRDTEILMRDKQLAEQKTQLDEQKTQLDEQKTQLDEQKTQLKASVRLMLSNNIPAEVIAQTLGLNKEEVEAFLACE